jgi:tetratricopeptide (TPR) repeat protein
MKTLSPDPLPSRRRWLPWASGLLTVLSAAVLVAGWPRTPLAEAPRPAPAAAATAEEIVARIPPLPIESEAGNALKLASDKVLAASRSADAWLQLGASLAQAQRSSRSAAYYDHAETAYRRAHELDPRSAEAMTGLAWVYGGRHRFAWSIEWARRALAVDADHAPAHGLLGDAALELGDYDAAFAHYQTMMDLRPDLSSWSRGAHLLWITGQKREGIALMERAIRSGAPFAENTAWCRVRLATMLLHDGALPAAAQALAPALRAAPRDPEVLLAAGHLAIAQDDFAGARRYFAQVLEAGQQHDALVALGDLCLVEGDATGAEEYFQQVAALHAANRASSAHDHTSMAKFLADHDRRLDEALKLATEHPDSPNVFEADVLAWVCFKKGDLPRAIAAMKRALAQNTPHPELHFHAGMIAAAAGDRVAATRHLQEALALNPRFHPRHANTARETLDRLTAARHSTANATR